MYGSELVKVSLQYGKGPTDPNVVVTSTPRSPADSGFHGHPNVSSMGESTEASTVYDEEYASDVSYEHSTASGMESIGPSVSQRGFPHDGSTKTRYSSNTRNLWLIHLSHSSMIYFFRRSSGKYAFIVMVLLSKLLVRHFFFCTKVVIFSSHQLWIEICPICQDGKKKCFGLFVCHCGRMIVIMIETNHESLKCNLSKEANNQNVLYCISIVKDWKP